MKRAIGHSETKLHDFVLTVYFLHNFELREMLRGRCGMGDWHVVDPKLARNIEDVEFPSDAVAPDQIAEYVKNEKKKLLSEVKEELYSVEEMEKYFCSQQRVCLDTAMHCFLVRGLNNRLYPKNTPAALQSHVGTLKPAISLLESPLTSEKKF